MTMSSSPCSMLSPLRSLPLRSSEAVEDEGDTEPLAARHEHLLAAPAETWHDEPVESWHSLLDDKRSEPVQPIDPAPPAAPPVEPVKPSAYSPEQGRSLFDFLAEMPPPKPSVEPIGFAHNGFHVDVEQRFQPLSRFEERREPQPPTESHKPDVLSPDYPLDFGSHAHHESPDEASYDRPSRHGLTDDEPRHYPFRSNGRHSRAESDDASSRGRHSRPGD